MSSRDNELVLSRIDDLRPTQITAGMREVDLKRETWRREGAKANFLNRHMIPVVLGPKKRKYILDHHHLALALYLEEQTEVLTHVMADLSSLPKTSFWYVLAHKNWVHLYDENGQPCERNELPKHVKQLRDDPCRSLAGEVRRSGGYAKDTSLYSEFLWAEFLRRQVDADLLKADFDAALKAALKVARSRQANYLPGWCGPVD